MSQLLQWIQAGEHQTQDFKFAIDDQKKIARTLAAFGNTDGGRLLIGVKDNGKIAGCHPEEEFHMIEGAAQLYCHPPIPFESQVHQEGFRLVLEIRVEAHAQRPYRAPDEEGKLKSYFRRDDRTLLVNKILHRVWQNEFRKTAKPETFGEEELSLLRIFQSGQEFTLSQLYRKAKVPMKKVDYWLALFVSWGLVEMRMEESRTVYLGKDV